MGSSGSKPEKDEALRLCGARLRFLKQAIDSRYALSAAHLAYIRSLRTVGTALRQFAEAEVSSTKSSLSAFEHGDTSPSPSPSPSHVMIPDAVASPRLSNLSYMKSSATSALTVRMDSPSSTHFGADEESLTFPIQPPPPPPGFNSTWDYFEPPELTDTKRLTREDGSPIPWDEVDVKLEKVHPFANASSSQAEMELLSAEREDASEFITHRAKDLVTSMVDIENRFVKAADSGHEVSRMLEANKIRLSSTFDVIGRTSLLSSPNAFLKGLDIPCCRKFAGFDHEPTQQVAKVITWTRSVSSMSSSSRNPVTLVVAPKDEKCGNPCDFAQDFCMISGSHSSTLDRLYAWERKLYDEVKASEFIRKRYDEKCGHLRNQCARDLTAKGINKTRAIIKDLHSQIRVAITSVDSISRRIEKVRDDELLPQFVELVQASIRMWKVMLECHHAQYITISLAYHGKKITAAMRRSDAYIKVAARLEDEIEVFNSSFIMWVGTHGAYLEAVNSWLQHCLLQPEERLRGRKVSFPPRGAIAPPIFILCRDWVAGMKALPAEQLSIAIKGVASELRACCRSGQHQSKGGGEEREGNTTNTNVKKEEEEEEEEKNSHLGSLQISLTKKFDHLSKFAEASVKIYEDIKESCEKARIDYVGGRIRFLT